MRKRGALFLALVLALSLVCSSVAFAENDDDTETTESITAVETGEETETEESSLEILETEEETETEEIKTEDESSVEILETEEEEEEETETEEESSAETLETEEEEDSTESGSSHGTATASGTTDDGLSWALYEDGTLVISGSGEMGDYYSDALIDYYGSITSIVIESGVTSIGAYAFTGMPSLTSINIASTVVSIGDYAFQGNTSLSGSFTIPSSVTSIGRNAFQSCSFTSVTIEGACNIGTSAFGGCSSLSYISIASGSTIGHYAFINTALDPTDSSSVVLNGNTYPEDAFGTYTMDLVSTDVGTATFKLSFVPEDVAIYAFESWDYIESGTDFTWSYDEETGYLTVSLTDEYMNSLEEGDYTFIIAALVSVEYDVGGSNTVTITIEHTAADGTDDETTDDETTDAVQTGDAGIMLYLILLAAAGCALIGGTVFNRRRA